MCSGAFCAQLLFTVLLWVVFSVLTASVPKGSFLSCRCHSIFLGLRRETPTKTVVSGDSTACLGSQDKQWKSEGMITALHKLYINESWNGHGQNLSLSKTTVSSGIQLSITMVAHTASKLLSRLVGWHMMYVCAYSNGVGRLFDM